MSCPPLHLQSLALLGLMAALGAGPLGCENNGDTLSSDDGGGSVDFFITPSAVQLGLGETVAAFTAQGGDAPLAWTVSDSALGTITDTEGRIANYNRAGATEGLNEVRVTDAIGRTAAAVVLQDDGVEGGPLQVSPGSRSIREADGLVTFEARGGAPPYQWSVIDPALGALSNTSQSFVNYRRNGNAAGSNVIELTDSQGTLVTATVQQPALIEQPPVP